MGIAGMLVLAAVLELPTGAFVPAHPTLRVRVYDAASLPVAVEAGTAATARAIFAAAGIDTSWVSCPHGRVAARRLGCDAPLHGREVALRILRGRGPREAGVLGTAAIDRASGHGVLATAFADRAEQVALCAGTEIAVVLGRVAAHEIGHLLLGMNSHSTEGLMRPVWPPRTLDGDHAAEFLFSPLQAGQLIRALIRADTTLSGQIVGDSTVEVE